MTIEVDFSERNPIDGVASLISERWSPRAFSDYAINSEQLARIIDAARWAPSCFNEQPWRFYTCTQESGDRFNEYLDLLVEANQVWAKRASVIGFLVGEKNFARNGKENDFYALDSGAAWMAMSLQARIEGLYTHGMGGIKKDQIAQYLKLDEEKQSVLMGFTIGQLASPSVLEESLQEKEKPTSRKTLNEIWFC